MTWTTNRYGMRSLLRSGGLLLFILLFVLQVIAPAATASASMAGEHEHHQEMSDPVSKCPMQAHNTGGTDAADLDASHQSAAHCKASICCFHDTMSSPTLLTVGALLSGAPLMDRGKAAAYKVGATQDRPPRHI